jgi:hypoxanthine phosphoribosyltransferase
MKDGQEIVIGLHRFEVYLAAQEIEKRIEALAETINAEYSGKKLLFISILNGSFMFTADILKKISLPCEVSFLKVSSYSGTDSSGAIKELIGLDREIAGYHVVIVEDIVDTGRTMDSICKSLKDKQAASLSICTLLDKPERREVEVQVKYIGFSIPDRFVVGYGLDLDGFGRNLPDIYQLKHTEHA